MSKTKHSKNHQTIIKFINKRRKEVGSKDGPLKYIFLAGEMGITVQKFGNFMNGKSFSLNEVQFSKLDHALENEIGTLWSMYLAATLPQEILLYIDSLKKEQHKISDLSPPEQSLLQTLQQISGLQIRKNSKKGVALATRALNRWLKCGLDRSLKQSDNDIIIDDTFGKFLAYLLIATDDELYSSVVLSEHHLRYLCNTRLSLEKKIQELSK